MHVFKWRIFKTTDEWYLAGNPTGRTVTVLDQCPRTDIPLYTTDATAAMKVLAKVLAKLGPFRSLFITEQGTCKFNLEGVDGCEKAILFGSVVGKSLEETICRFARILFDPEFKWPDESIL